MPVTAKWYGKEVSADVRQAGLGGLRDGAEHILEEANRTIPHQEGTMQGSGTTSVDASKMQASISYNTPYSRRQHEDTRLRHGPGRRAKWLQLTLKERSKPVQEMIANALRKALKGR